MAKTTDIIRDKIHRMPRGHVFTYSDFIDEVESKQAVVKALNRMAIAGDIAKLSKGKYYKVEKTPFGNLEPDQYQVVKDLLEDDDGKTIGYLTGLSIYSNLGLSTQVSASIQIARNDIRPKLKRGKYNISFVKQKNIITKGSIPILQLLDCVRYIKKIPDTTFVKAYQRIQLLIRECDDTAIKNLMRLSKKYPPSTRALLGSLLDSNGYDSMTDPLLESLNPITIYKYPSEEGTIYNPSKWNIDESTP